MYTAQRHYSEQIQIKPKSNEIDLMDMVKERYEQKSEEEKSPKSNREHSKQMTEQEESKHSKDS